MLFEAHEDEDAYADDPKLRAKWLESVDQTIELEAEWEDIVPDRRIVLLLRDHGQGDLYVVKFMSAGYEEDEIQKIWIDDSKMDISCSGKSMKISVPISMMTQAQIRAVLIQL